MPSITVINATNTVINSTITCAGINSSVHNSFGPGEFYVHNAPGVYTLNTRYFTGPSSFYEENWEVLGEILGELIIDAAAIGLMVIGVGEVIAGARLAAAAVDTANLTRAAAVSAQASAIWAKLGAQTGEVILKHTMVAAFDLTGAVLQANSLRVASMPRDADWTNISGYHDRVFVVEGGLDLAQPAANATVDAKFKPLTIREIKSDDFTQMKRDGKFFEMSYFGNPVFVDAQDQQYYIDEEGNHVYSPGGDEYYVDSAKQRHKVHPNRQSRKKTYTESRNGDPMTSNPDGNWEPAIYTHGSKEHVVQVDGIEVRAQPGHGIINLRLLYGHNHATTWVRDEMGSTHAKSFERRVAAKRINKVEVLEEGGYGITDLRFFTDEGSATGWLVGNAVVDPGNKNVVKNGRVIAYSVPAGNVLVGVVAKAQGAYGIVDLQFVLHKA